jgi:hypothetical protein
LALPAPSSCELHPPATSMRHVYVLRN